MENLIRANLRIITQETVFQKALRTVPPVKGQSTVIQVFETKGWTSNDVLWAVYTIQIYTSKASNGSWVIVTPYQIKRKGYLLRNCDPL